MLFKEITPDKKTHCPIPTGLKVPTMEINDAGLVIPVLREITISQPELVKM